MAPLPSNSTARFYVDYVTGSGNTATEHTFQVRYNEAVVDIVDLDNWLLSLLNGITAAELINGWRVLGYRIARAGSDFSTPAQPSAAVLAFRGTYTARAITERDESVEWSFQGRSFSSGRRVDLSLYGLGDTAPSGFRAFRADSSFAWVGAVVDLLNQNPANSIGVAIDGTTVTWYDYVNTQQNSYWERRFRRS